MTGENNQIAGYMLNNISWIIPTTVASFLGIITIILTIKLNKKKKLGYYEVYKNNIIDLSSAKFNKNVSIKYDDKELKKLGYLLCEIKNIGNETIEKRDFIDTRGITISVEGCNVIGFTIKENKYGIFPCQYGNELSTMLFDLNIGESIQLEIFTDGDIINTKIDARIKGIKEITKYNVNKMGLKLKIFSISSIFFYFVIRYLNNKALGNMNKPLKDQFANNIYLVLIIISLVLIGISYFFLFKKVSSRNKNNPFYNEKNERNIFKKLIGL